MVTKTETGRKPKRVRLIIVALALVCGLVLSCVIVVESSKRRAQFINCRSNMISIGLAARMWANDHDETFPTSLVSLSNELNTTKVLFCSSDRKHPRPKVSDWSTFDEAGCSYEIVSRGIRDGDSSKVFLKCTVHGHLGYGDGSVFDGVKRSANKHEN